MMRLRSGEILTLYEECFRMPLAVLTDRTLIIGLCLAYDADVTYGRIDYPVL